MQRWQLARKTQCPSFMPSSSMRLAIGPWPCPREREKNFSPMPLISAFVLSITTGSTPGDRTKMRGAVGVESVYTESRSKGGGSTNLGPRLLATKAETPNTTRSGRRKRMRTRRCNSLHLFSHSPGRGADSGSGDWYHFFQSPVFCSKDEEMLRMLGSLFSISAMLSHAIGWIQVESGFGGCEALSTRPPPRRKYWYSSLLILPERWRILTHICREKRSLCFSKRDLQMLR
mmetsp:Transcript_35836/g.83894  ORF Transcript_35836/g.83894 Transcript_35836/m.83894 type:complete len:231 (+) Transcript_35836:1765-2457(+)